MYQYLWKLNRLACQFIPGSFIWRPIYIDALVTKAKYRFETGTIDKDSRIDFSMLTETYTVTGILIIICFVILPIFWLVLLIILNLQYRKRIKTIHQQALEADFELQTLRKRYNQSWILIQQQQKTIMDQKTSKFNVIEKTFDPNLYLRNHH